MLKNNLTMTIKKWLEYHQNFLHHKQRYRGLQMIKNPFDLIIYEEILWEIKPTIIIEIGTANGGFTLWLKDRMQIINQKSKIITIDLNVQGSKNLRKFKTNKVISIVNDCNSTTAIAEVKKYIDKNSKVLIFEDSLHTFENTIKVLNNYSQFVSIGSYFIVEDGICDVLKISPCPGPTKAVEKWIKNHKGFIVDKTKERYSMTYNPMGYLKRIKL